MKKYNFYSGPAILPQEVFEQASKAVIEYDHIGLSLIEISHRSKEFTQIVDETQQRIKEITGLGDAYKVLFLQGGATQQFCMIPYNLLGESDTASYMDVGAWSKKAIKEARLFGQVHVACSSSDESYTYMPTNFDVPESSRYLHITTNETIQGTQMKSIPNVGCNLIADMSSDIFSRQLNWNQFDMIYAGAQKNLGPSGVTLVIVKESILGKLTRNIPTILDYRVHIKDNSLHNTPSTFGIYVMLLTLRWLQKEGGLAVMEQRNKEKAQLLYDAIDRSPLFTGVARKDSRSDMNVTWTINKPELEDAFNTLAKDNGCIGIKGHRSVGGFRASIYNAMPRAGVELLINLIDDFSKKHG
ncbi:MAG: 3-phosphoserine/phosphohydroxythreonine transaminase [Bacteroidota bacterium]